MKARLLYPLILFYALVGIAYLLLTLDHAFHLELKSATLYLLLGITFSSLSYGLFRKRRWAYHLALFITTFSLALGVLGFIGTLALAIVNWHEPNYFLFPLIFLIISSLPYLIVRYLRRRRSLFG